MDNLAGVIRQIAGSEYERQSPTDLTFGVVTSGPDQGLRIKVENRFEIGASHLILSGLCVEKKVTVHEGREDEDELVLWEGLMPGERVRMLRCGRGQLYYVLDRESTLE